MQESVWLNTFLAPTRDGDEIDDHCWPTEALQPLVMSAVLGGLRDFLLDWLQHALPSGAGTHEIALETTAVRPS